MDSLNDPVKLLARRFTSLPPQVRLRVAGRLLRLRGEDETLKETDGRRRQKSFLEQFWEEVEAAHGDGLHPSNPFAGKKSGPLVCPA